MSRLLITACLIATLAAGEPIPSDDVTYRLTTEASVFKRAYFEDSIKIFNRKRNAHACIMSIVFIVLFPLGAISQHLPLRGVRVTTRVHAPIQLLGLIMMIGAMGLGIDMAKVDLNFFASGSSTKAHIIIGLLVCSTLILLQPAMGIFQHLYFKKHGTKSLFAYAHRWIGRVTIVLGWINSYLGFRLYGLHFVATSSLVRNFTLMGVLGAVWFSLVSWNGVQHHFLKQDKVSAYRLGWRQGLVMKKPDPAATADDNIKLDSHNAVEHGSFDSEVGQRT